MSRAGLGHEHKPVGSFCSPANVGKTGYGVSFQKRWVLSCCFDMSEYMEREPLIGAPPIRRFRPYGLPTHATYGPTQQALMRSKKAHPISSNLLLQVMDNGTLTDNNGRAADFRNVVLVMTTTAREKPNVNLLVLFIRTTVPMRWARSRKRRAPVTVSDNIIWFDHLSGEVISSGCR